MRKKPIMPENFSKRKFILVPLLNFTLVDTAVFILLSGLGILQLVFVWKTDILLYKIFSIFSCLALSFFGWFITQKSKVSNKKIYAVIWDAFIFLFVKKKYKYGTNYDTKFLVPYTHVEEDFLVTRNQKYVSFIKVNGNAFFDYEYLKQEQILESVWNCLQGLKLGGSIIKLDEIKSRKDTLFLLEEKRNHWIKLKEENKINEKQYFSRIKIIDEQIKKHSTYDTNDLSEWIEKSIYIGFYGETLEEIQKLENMIISNFKIANLHPVKLNLYKKINIINKIIDVDIIDDIESNISKHCDDLEEYFSHASIENKSSFLKINNEFKATIQTIDGYEKQPECGWLSNIFQIPEPVVLNFSKVDEKQFQTTLAKARRIAIVSQEGTRKKEILTLRKKEAEIAAMEDFADIIGYGIDNLYNFAIHIITKAESRKELNFKLKYTKEILDNEKLKLDINAFRQVEAFSGILPKPYDPLLDSSGRQIPLYTIVWGMPFISSNLNDEGGLHIGKTVIGEDLYFNSHIRNFDRKNANMFLVSTSGGGKSTSTQKLMINEMINGNKIYIIDPENEYSKFADYFGESKIFLGDGIYKINPLQIMPTIADLQNDVEQEKVEHNSDFWNIKKVDLIEANLDLNEMLIANHQSIIEILFRNFFKDIEEQHIRYLKNKFWFFYKEWQNNAKSKDILSWKNNEFPILQDFYKYIYNLNIKEESKLQKDVIEYFEDAFVENMSGDKKGTYANFYNGFTSIEISEDYLTVFDLSSLKDNGDTKLLSMQMFLTIKLIERQIKINHSLEPNVPQRIVVDEAHLLIDKDFPIALDFIFRMVKMIRKRNGGITIITQNPEDFVSEPSIMKKTKAIINNSQYALILQLTNDNIKQMEKMYSDTEGFTSREKVYLETATAGDGLLITGKNKKYLMSFDVTSEDFKIIRGEEKDLEKYAHDNLTNRLYNTIDGVNSIDFTSNDVVNVDELDGIKTLKIKIIDESKINLNSLNSYLEISKVYFEDNILEVKFKPSHGNIADKFKDKIMKKIYIMKQNALESKSEIVDEEIGEMGGTTNYGASPE